MSLNFSDVSAGPLGQFEVTRLTHPVDIWVGTPMKVLEMVHGWGWDRRRWKMRLNRRRCELVLRMEKLATGNWEEAEAEERTVDFGVWKSKPDVGLTNIEWSSLMKPMFFLVSFQV